MTKCSTFLQPTINPIETETFLTFCFIKMDPIYDWPFIILLIITVIFMFYLKFGVRISL